MEILYKIIMLKKNEGNLILIYVGQFLFAFHHNKKNIHIFYASRTEFFILNSIIDIHFSVYSM